MSVILEEAGREGRCWWSAGGGGGEKHELVRDGHDLCARGSSLHTSSSL